MPKRDSRPKPETDDGDFRLNTRVKPDAFSAMEELQTLKCEYLGDRVSRGVVVRLALLYYLEAARKLGSLPPVPGERGVKRR